MESSLVFHERFQSDTIECIKLLTHTLVKHWNVKSWPILSLEKWPKLARGFLYINKWIRYLSWKKKQCNDIIMMQKMSLLLNYKKSVLLDDIFDFTIFKSHDKGVLYAYVSWLLILLVLFFYFCNSFEFTNSNKKYLHKSLLLQSCAKVESQKLSATKAPFWLLPLHWWVLPPSNNAGLFDCHQGLGGCYLFGCTSHSAVWTVQKLIN